MSNVKCFSVMSKWMLLGGDDPASFICFKNAVLFHLFLSCAQAPCALSQKINHVFPPQTVVEFVGGLGEECHLPVNGLEKRSAVRNGGTYRIRSGGEGGNLLPPVTAEKELMMQV